MPHRQGKKVSGKHTTLTDFASDVVDIVAKLPSVKKISNGIINPGKSSRSGIRRVRISQQTGGIHLSVRQATSVQTLHVFCEDGQTTVVAIARALRNADIKIHFRNAED